MITTKKTTVDTKEIKRKEESKYITTGRKTTSQAKEPMTGNRTKRWRKRQNPEAAS